MSSIYEYRAKVIRVIDGDTLALAVDLGCDVTLNLTVRLYGVNCPEMKGDTRVQGGMARHYTSNWLQEHASATQFTQQVTLKTHKDKREKFGRYLADIYADGRHLNADLVEAGHAARYEP
ncbi:thermonuclease family protein [Streptomyces sp. NPDC012769]|uniref:thermonuclease family protein n=1 Tax=Streptomyces sp. NPDC012769 TaxID=3364848 RepID=UPI0036BB4807